MTEMWADFAMATQYYPDYRHDRNLHQVILVRLTREKIEY